MPQSDFLTQPALDRKVLAFFSAGLWIERLLDSNTRVLTVGIDDLTNSDLAKVSILKATT